MFGRKKAPPSAPATTYVERAGAKNRPTPKRRDQEAARKRPLVPADRKAANSSARRQAQLERGKQRQAMLTGDEAHLPARDAGPVRRFLRDGVDARWNLGEFLLPVMVLVLLISFLGSTVLKSSGALVALFAIVYILILVAIVDAAMTARRLRAKAAAKFGDAAIPRGVVMYTVMRSFQLRRTRLPRPMVKRGERPY